MGIYQLPPGKFHRWVAWIDGQWQAIPWTASSGYRAIQAVARDMRVSQTRVSVVIVGEG